MSIKEKDLIEDLKQVRERIGDIPSAKKYRKEGRYHPSTFDRKFGSWNNSLQIAFGEVLQKSPEKKYLKKCIKCGDMTFNPKFCSASCAAIHNNKLRGGPPVFCKKCGRKIQCNSTFCLPCRKLNTIKKYGEKTIGEFRTLPAVAKNRYVLVRQHAARVMKYYNSTKDNCLFCDYSNHIQLCHIKDIGDFPDEITLNIINDPANLVYLCPNHHWDLDHGFLSDEEMSTIRSRNLIIKLSG